MGDKLSIVIFIAIIIYTIFNETRCDKDIKELIKNEAGFIGINPSKYIKLYKTWKEECEYNKVNVADDKRMSLDKIRNIRLYSSFKSRKGKIIPVFTGAIGSIITMFTTIYTIRFDIMEKLFTIQSHTTITTTDVENFRRVLGRNFDESIQLVAYGMLIIMVAFLYSIYCHFSKWQSLKNICDEILDELK